MSTNHESSLSSHNTETDSVVISTPSLVESPSLQSHLTDASALTQQSHETTENTSSISIKTPSIVSSATTSLPLSVASSVPSSTMIDSTSEQIITPTTIDPSTSRPDRSPRTALSILTFRAHDLRAPQGDDAPSSVLVSDQPHSDLSSSRNSSSRESHTPPLCQANTGIDTVTEESTRSAKCHLSVKDTQDDQTSSLRSLADLHKSPVLTSTEQDLRIQISVLEAELAAARAEIVDLCSQANKPAETVEASVQCGSPGTPLDRSVSPIAAKDPVAEVTVEAATQTTDLEPVATETADAEVQLEATAKDVIELDRQEYSDFMVIATKYQNENKMLWEQMTAKKETITAITAMLDSVGTENEQLKEQLGTLMEENEILQRIAQEQADLAMKSQAMLNETKEKTVVDMQHQHQQTETAKCTSRGVRTMTPKTPKATQEAVQQTTPRISAQSIVQEDEAKDRVAQRIDEEQIVEAGEALKALDTAIEQKYSELNAILEKISGVGVWYSKEVKRLEDIQRVQTEADNALQRAKEDSTLDATGLLEVGGSVLPAPSHDGVREQNTINKLLDALNFDSYQGSDSPGDATHDRVLAYTSSVLPRIADIQRMLRAIQKEYYAYLEQIKRDARIIAVLTHENAALEATNKELKDALPLVEAKLAPAAVQEAYMRTETEAESPCSEASASMLINQLITIVVGTMIDRKALDTNALEEGLNKQMKTIAEDMVLDLTLDPDDITNELVSTANVVVSKEVIDQLCRTQDPDDSISMVPNAIREDLHKSLLAILQKQDQSMITQHSTVYDVHFAQSKLNAIILRHQVIKILVAIQAFLPLVEHCAGTASTTQPLDADMPLTVTSLQDAMTAVGEHCPNAYRELVELLKTRDKRVQTLELLLLTLYQQSLYFFTKHKSVLDIAALSLQKQDSLIMYSDIGAINMIILQAKMCLSHSIDANIKEAALRDTGASASADMHGALHPSQVEYLESTSYLDRSARDSLLPKHITRHEMRNSLALSTCDLATSQNYDTTRQTPLMRAVIEGNYGSITPAIINKYARCQDADGMTALMYAAVHRRFGLISKLASAEAGIALPDGRTALYLALELRYMDIAEELRAYEGIPVARVPAPSKISNSGFTGSRRGSHGKLETSMSGASEPVASTRVSCLTNLMAAAEKNDLVTIWVLIPTEGCIQDAKGRTALMYAAYAGNLRAVELLVQFEARMQDANGCTALMYAVQAGHIEVVKFLADGETGVINSMFSTALMMAVRLQSEDMVKVLAPAECGLQGYRNGSTRDRLVTQTRGRKRAVDPKEFFSADVDGSGVTALMIAANIGFKYAVILLLSEEVNLIDRNGYSASDYAAYGKGDAQVQKEIVGLLRSVETSKRNI